MRTLYFCAALLAAAPATILAQTQHPATLAGHAVLPAQTFIDMPPTPPPT